MENLNNSIPKRRFAGFTDHWEQRKLGELCDVYDGTHQTPNYQNSGIMFLSVENINSLRSDKYISEEDFIKDFSIFPKKGDVLMTRIGDIGTANVVESDEPKAYYVSLALLKKKLLDSYFLKESISSETVKKDLWKRTLHIAFPKKINKNEIAEILVPYPKKREEQEQIGIFFNYLDNLITLQQRKLDKLKDTKKSYLSEMFPAPDETKPKRRFAGFTGDWEQCKWCETVDISTEMVDPKTGEYDDLPHIAPGNIESFTGRIYDNVKTVKEENLISGKFRFRPNDIIYGKINPQLAKYIYAEIDGLTSADAYVLNSKSGITQKFLFAVLQTKDFYKYTVSVSKRSGMPKINRDELNAYDFMAPTEEEQTKIGEYLLSLDNLIALHQRKLDKLKSLKQAYLKEMFV